MSTSTGDIPVEFLKAVSDHCKHITTLSSGFILVMVTFLDKLFDIPEWQKLVVVSFVAFALSIIFSVVSQAFVIDYMYPVSELDTPKKASITWVILLLTWASFTIGAISLILFAVKNFI